MRSIYIKIIGLVFICLTAGFSGSGRLVIAQGTLHEPYRILIDASKDGGSWWFPQWQYFDAEQHHQGKSFADLLRQDGAEVIELPRGESVTPQKLGGFDLVIRLSPFYAYSPSEAIAYRDSVAAGTRLLFIGGGNRNSDPIAEVFGLDFERRTHFASLTRWIRHPYTASISGRDENVWSGVTKAPKEAVVLGWMNRKNETPVLGYLPYGKGYVVFVGRASISRLPEHSFARDLINSIRRYSLDDLMQMQATQVITSDIPPGPGPVLIAPTNNSDLPQPGDGEWRFDWEDVPGADTYEIVILGSSAHVPLGHIYTQKSEFNVGGIRPGNPDERYKAGYIADHNLRGWSWKVRARLSNGKWGDWSSERRFNVRRRER